MERFDDKNRKPILKIDSDSLLLVEGKDEYQFFQALLKKINIKDVQIYDVKGNNNFHRELAFLVRAVGFSKVTKIGFVRDAEKKEPKSAFDSICKVLKDTNILEILPCNIGKVEKIGNFKIGIFIMPNNKDKGMLETLYLQSIKDMHCQKEMRAYIECLKKHYEENPSFNLEKVETQVYLASKVPIRSSLGLGVLTGHVNFEDSVFDEIKLFLKELFE